MGKTQKKTVQKSSPGALCDWLYMSERAVSLEQIYEEMTTTCKMDVEIWPQAEVLEICVGEKASIDVERASIADFEDDFSKAFLSERGIAEVYYVNYPADGPEGAKCKAVLEKLCAGLGGMLVGDTDDFTPVIKG